MNQSIGEKKHNTVKVFRIRIQKKKTNYSNTFTGIFNESAYITRVTNKVRVPSFNLILNEILLYTY